MHKIKTIQGKNLWYDVKTNRIGLCDSSIEKQTCPVVCFNSPTNIDTDRITMFTIEMTQECNLRCKYCCYSGEYRDRRAHNEKEISYEVLSEVVSFVKKYSDENASEITICFYGGEALLAKDKIDWFIQKLRVETELPVVYSLSTNGFAITESVIDWICSYEKFLVNVTIDGDKVMHDANRVTRNGNGSYDTILKNLHIFKEKYPVEYDKRVRFLSTVYSLNDVVKLSKVWNEEKVLANHYPVHISHIIPNFKDIYRKYDTWQIKNDFYCKAFESYKRGENNILVASFKKLINIVAHRNYCHLSETLTIKTCFQELWSSFINVDGDIYACEKFCGETKIGNVSDGFDKMKMLDLLKRFTDRKNRFCSQCWAMRFCRMCMTGLNHTDEEIQTMCDMERDTIDIALKYYCELKDWKHNNKNIKV